VYRPVSDAETPRAGGHRKHLERTRAETNLICPNTSAYHLQGDGRRDSGGTLSGADAMLQARQYWSRRTPPPTPVLPPITANATVTQTSLLPSLRCFRPPTRQPGSGRYSGDRRDLRYWVHFARLSGGKLHHSRLGAYNTRSSCSAHPHPPLPSVTTLPTSDINEVTPTVTPTATVTVLPTKP
jgi:hypothetical protein